jgi:ABC-type Fe3+-hydroxamate transport system substrate-binding protein
VICTTDDVGRKVRVPCAARRVVSLVPSLTETMFALGRGDVLIAVTRYCTEPKAGVRGLERVGGTKNPNVARIGALRPDLVIASAEENRKEDFDALVRAGLTVFVAFPLRVHDVAGMLARLGKLIGARAAAETLAKEQEESLRQVDGSGATHPPRVFCPIWMNPWMSFNRDTYAHDILWRAGGQNVCAARDQRYCTVTSEEIAATEPEVILLPDEPYRFTPRVLPNLAPFHGTPAWHTNRIHFIDGKALSWYGARTAPGLRALRSFLTTQDHDA